MKANNPPLEILSLVLVLLVVDLHEGMEAFLALQILQLLKTLLKNQTIDR